VLNDLRTLRALRRRVDAAGAPAAALLTIRVGPAARTIRDTSAAADSSCAPTMRADMWSLRRRTRLSVRHALHGQVAPAIAQAARPLLDGSLTIHVGGCAKGCAHPGPLR